ncbi:asparagine synthase (glutamine-hydrolyzing) [Acidovorax sp. HDW3]|uniref:asparagine synthase (glutamine-hydrolyzing) n=1 Tax=Acidovorax sp. HDW3 TaxID=2714923 RepID=UPI00140A9477|nr:asparagine synthase (glutamine-hydrolyzing) [Acidovorax sp. HDW3]QIL42840.1 asparagine synthase (glutamine-hydrolyzing) [Acidovorax sp. HDW3]
MCGIAGGWWTNPDQAATRLRSALQNIKHRGPDDSGHQLYPVGNAVVALGHARLSIIDLSAAGHQPMHSPDGRWAIIFNGEIYNYRELRTELQAHGHRFSSDSDTEVLLAAWAQWGSACLPRLAGMFAFVVLDKAQATLTCVRDAFGIKPFFYSAGHDGGRGFAFASELPALLPLLPGKPQLNWQRAYDYLVHGDYDSTPDTFYAGVHHLSPGHWLQVNAATGQATAPQRWWVPQIQERPGWRFDDAVEQVREQFLQNIRLHLRSDVPLGAALSGGIDSSAVVCAMRHVEPDLPIHTFSFIAEGSDVNEEHWVDCVNSHVGAIAHKVTATGQDLARDLSDMIRAQGEPFGSTSIYAQYRVFQLAKESGITVTLDGQGADEMLAGYSGYPGQRLRSLLETGQMSAAWQFWNEWAKWPGRSRMLAAKYLVAELTDGGLYEALRKLDGKPSTPHWINPGPLLEQGVHLSKSRIRPEFQTKGRRVMDELALSLSRRGLSHLLRHGDRNSMRFSIESRVPFLTLGMVNLMLSMPENFLISKTGETKHIFRAAMRGIAPDDVLNRKDKIGFATPEKDWLLGVAPTLRQWLQEDLRLPFLDQIKILQEFDVIVAGKKEFSWQVWRWVNFAKWMHL